jgi:integrase/recombinase XerD
MRANRRTGSANSAMAVAFVQQLRLQRPHTSSTYLRILENFDRFVAVHCRCQPLSVEVIQNWLRDRTSVWPLPLLEHHTRLVDRYMQWRVGAGSLQINPLSELRKQYGQRTTAPIVRALLVPDSARALEALRPLPRFGSFLGEVMRDHVALMKSRGYRYDTGEGDLLRFDKFLQSRTDLSHQPLRVLVQEWAKVGTTPRHAWNCYQVGRILSQALRRIDPATEGVPRDHHLNRLTRQSYRRPHIYSEKEVQRLFETARSWPSPHSPLRPLTLYTMLVLAYCAGLRLGEIVHLNLGDVHLGDETIEIRNTKFFKSRRLPLAASTMSVLRHYLNARRQAGAPDVPASGLFWHPKASGHYARVTAGNLLRGVLRRAELKPIKGRTGPRIHDLRHAFVVNRMLAWYREGINPQPRLPYLATYLGHKNINSTLVYLTITQELLQQASERFRVLGARILRASTGGKL